MEAYKKETIFTYDSNVAGFEKKFQDNFEKYGREDLERFISNLKGGKVVDIGCGPGVYLEAMREAGLDAMGIDLSESFIERCHEKGLNVRKMDMENPLLYPHSFDGLWAHAVLPHVPRERVAALLQTWTRLLKRDGLLWLSLREGEGEGFDADASNTDRKRWLTFYTDEEVRKLVGKRFEVIHFEQTDRSGKKYLKYLLRLKPEAPKAFRNF